MENKLFKKLTIFDKILGLRKEKTNIIEILKDIFINEMIIIIISFCLVVLPIAHNVVERFLVSFLACQFCLLLHIFYKYKAEYNNTSLISFLKKSNQRTYLGKFEKRNDNLLWTLKKWFYPKEYKEEFHKIISSKFGDDENLDKFNNWIANNIITVENLYYLIIGKESVQKEILKEIEDSEKTKLKDFNNKIGKRVELKKEIEEFKIQN